MGLVLRLAAGLSLLPALLLAPAAAQGTRPDRTRLADALSSAPWDPAERGPLLAVDPGGVTASDADAPPVGARPVSLSALAPRFSRRLVRVGTVTALAPETMVVLNPRPEGPDAAVAAPNLSREEAFRLLLPTLSESQWKAVGSDGGIGMGDTETPEQRALFAALSAAPMPVSRYSRVRSEPERRTLPSKQLAGLRFRIQRTALFQLTSTGKDGNIYAGPLVSPSSAPEGEYPLLLDRNAAGRLQQESAGTWTEREERNRLKPGDLDFAAEALNPAVRLAGVSTVGEAVRRCAAATGRELYADGRMARLPLYLKAAPGASARAGDLLKSLCWMVTGAFRRVGEGSDAAWVLTDDLAGYGTRRARMVEARRREWQRSQAAGGGREDRPGPAPWRLLSDSAALGFTPTDALRAALDAPPRTLTLPTEAIPSNVQRLLDEAAEKHRGLPLRRNLVDVRIVPRLEYLVPDLPPIYGSDDRMMTLLFSTPRPRPEPLPEPGPVPAALPDGTRAGLTLLATARSAESAREIVRVAAERGIRRLWLEGDADAVRAAVAAGQGAGVAVGAVVPLLRARPGEDAPRDVDILGHAGDWLLPDAPQTLAAARARCLAFAGVPGLAGLILTDTAAPGYGVPEGDLLAEDGSEMGYTVPRRLAYLRAAGFDPIDLVRGSEEREQPLPFLRDRLGWDETSAGNDRAMFQANRGWGAARCAANLALMRRLFAELRAGHPALPLWVRSRGALRYWYGSWDSPAGLPYFNVSPPTPVRPASYPTLLQVARRQAGKVLLGVAYRPGQYAAGQAGRDTRYAELPDNAAALARAVNLAVNQHRGDWDGLVLDLRDVPLATLPALLPGVEPR